MAEVAILLAADRKNIRSVVAVAAAEIWPAAVDRTNIRFVAVVAAFAKKLIHIEIRFVRGFCLVLRTDNRTAVGMTLLIADWPAADWPVLVKMVGPDFRTHNQFAFVQAAAFAAVFDHFYSDHR